MSAALAMIDPSAHSEVAPPAPPSVVAESPAMPETPVAPIGPEGAAVPPPIPSAAAAGSPPPIPPSASPPPPPPPIPGPATAAVLRNGRIVDSAVSEKDRTYALLLHLTLLLAGPAPFLSILAPLIMWQVKRHESPFIDDHGREAVNFHISVLIYGLIALVLIPLVVGIPLMTMVFALGVVGVVLSSVAARRGEYYRYPMCLRFLK